MVLGWLRRAGSLIKRWFRDEPTLQLAVDVLDHWLYLNGLGLTERTNDMNLTRFMLILLSTVPWCLIYVVGCIYYYMVDIMPYEAMSSTGTVSTGLSFMVGQMAINKLFWFILKRHEITRVLRQALDLGSVTLPSWSWRLITVLNSALYLITVYTLCMPLLADHRMLPEDHYLIPGLENKLESPSYEINYLINGFTYLNVYLLAAYYSIFIGLAGHLTGHYIQLCSDFENLLDGVVLYSYPTITNNIDERKLKDKLSRLIEHHCKIIECFKNVRSLFNAIGGHDFGLITLAFGVLLVSVRKLGVKFLFGFFVYISGSLFLYCITGETLRSASEGLETSVWCSGWEYLDPVSRRSLLLVLLRAQKPIILTAGAFVGITYQTLMIVLKTCFSIYATFDATNTA